MTTLHCPEKTLLKKQVNLIPYLDDKLVCRLHIVRSVYWRKLTVIWLLVQWVRLLGLCSYRNQICAQRHTPGDFGRWENCLPRNGPHTMHLLRGSPSSGHKPWCRSKNMSCFWWRVLGCIGDWCKVWRRSPQFICCICTWTSGEFTHTTFPQIWVLVNPPKFIVSRLSQLPHSHPATVGDFPVGRRIQSLQLFTHECVKIFSRVDSWQEVGPATRRGKR